MHFERLRASEAGDEDVLKPEEKRALVGWITRILLTAAATILLLVAATLFFRPVYTQGYSMDPALTEGDWGLAWVWNYTPAHGDVVVVKDAHIDNKQIVKRVVGMPGDRIHIDFEAGVVYRNGQPLVEPYATPTHTSGDVEFPLVVPEGRYFVMGDNRGHSTDSRTRYVGMVEERYLAGKVVWRIYPFDKFGGVE